MDHQSPVPVRDLSVEGLAVAVRSHPVALQLANLESVDRGPSPFPASIPSPA